MVIVDIATGSDSNPDTLVATGAATNAVFIDSNGDRFPGTVDDVPSGGGVTYSFGPGMAAGAGIMILSMGDPAVRGKFGEWLGTYAADYTIT